MTDCCATFTTFSTVITTSLINQKPVETKKESSEAVNTWLASTLLSRGYGRDMEDPVRERCLKLLRGDEEAVKWYDAFRAKKKVNKLQQRFMESKSRSGESGCSRSQFTARSISALNAGVFSTSF